MRFLPALLLSALLVPALAQPAPLKLGNLEVSGSLRSRLEMWDYFTATGNSDYAFSGNLFRLSLAQKRARFDWQFELAAPLLAGLPSDALAAAPQSQLGLGANYFAANSNRSTAAMLFPKQGYVRLKNLFGVKDQSLRLGRFEWMDGSEATPKDATLAALKRDRINQRLIGPFGWSTVGRSFDGLHYSLNHKTLNATLVSALPTRGAFQVDGWGPLKTAFVYASLTGQTGQARSAGEWRVLSIYYQDWRHVTKTDNRPAPVRAADLTNLRIGTYGGHYLHKWDTSSLGTFNILLWGVAQNGRWGRQAHRASAYDVEAGYQPKLLPKLKPWLSLGSSRGSGDDNPSDNRHGSFFQLLPTPRPFARTPLYDMVNNQDLFATLALRPHKLFTLRAEAHSLRLASPRDLWYSGGGAFQPSTFGYAGRNTVGARSLANQWDLSADWNPNPHLNLNAYAGYLDGKAAIQTIYPKGATAVFTYLEATWKF